MSKGRLDAFSDAAPAAAIWLCPDPRFEKLAEHR